MTDSTTSPPRKHPLKLTRKWKFVLMMCVNVFPSFPIGSNRILPRIAPTGGFTITAWVHPSTRKQQYIVDKGSASSPYLLFLTGDDLVFTVNTDEGSGQIRSAGHEPDRWHHLVGTYDGEVMRLYKNGELVSTAEVEENLRSTTRALTIGSHGDGCYFFAGRIDAVKLYAGARAPSAIESDYGEVTVTAH